MGAGAGLARMKAGAGKSDLSDPKTFFALAHSLGWGATNPKYFPLVTGAYDTVRRGAAEMESSSKRQAST
jgi:hypothetical protein